MVSPHLPPPKVCGLRQPLHRQHQPPLGRQKGGQVDGIKLIKHQHPHIPRELHSCSEPGEITIRERVRPLPQAVVRPVLQASGPEENKPWGTLGGLLHQIAAQQGKRPPRLPRPPRHTRHKHPRLTPVRVVRRRAGVESIQGVRPCQGELHSRLGHQLPLQKLRIRDKRRPPRLSRHLREVGHQEGLQQLWGSADQGEGDVQEQGELGDGAKHRAQRHGLGADEEVQASEPRVGEGLPKACPDGHHVPIRLVPTRTVWCRTPEQHCPEAELGYKTGKDRRSAQA
mmetsp:Transcript_80672/g.184871  ORF Transcript_80672/g.184871 Transcript_80672/m.184871 type:complete len:284 (+) Transcript_80672:394-1245(+)